jgi:hypothetical protein
MAHYLAVDSVETNESERELTNTRRVCWQFDVGDRVDDMARIGLACAHVCVTNALHEYTYGHMSTEILHFNCFLCHRRCFTTTTTTATVPV